MIINLTLIEYRLILTHFNSFNQSELSPINLEIERTCREIRARRRKEMEEARANEKENLQVPVRAIEPTVIPTATKTSLRNIQCPVITSNPSCIRLSARARNYEFKNIHLNLLPQFHGLRTEDALSFIREFYNVVETLPLHGINEEELKMRCFPYCMKDGARQWHIRDEIYEQFVLKYYPPQLTNELRNKIWNFS